jgi:hypothetical protein
MIRLRHSGKSDGVQELSLVSFNKQCSMKRYVGMDTTVLFQLQETDCWKLFIFYSALNLSLQLCLPIADICHWFDLLHTVSSGIGEKSV